MPNRFSESFCLISTQYSGLSLLREVILNCCPEGSLLNLHPGGYRCSPAMLVPLLA